jgi:cell wall-associated NlpC family hydrolase
LAIFATNVYASVGEGVKVAKYSVKLEGIRYQRGGDSPTEGFDCSGLINYIFNKKANIDLPRTSTELARLPSKKLNRFSLKKGDILFFKMYNRVDHVGVYIGNKQFVHAAGKNDGVKISSLNTPYWRSVFVFGKRVSNR